MRLTARAAAVRLLKPAVWYLLDREGLSRDDAAPILNAAASRLIERRYRARARRAAQESIMQSISIRTADAL